MSKPRTTRSILSEIVASLSWDIPIINIVDNSDGTYDLEVCDTHHQSNNNCRITLDGKKYRIVGVETNEKIVIKEVTSGSGPPNITTFPLAAPKFFHGTALDVGMEMVDIQNVKDKVPFVYMHERFTERYDVDRTSSIDRIANLRLFLMDQATIQKGWKTDEHYDNVIDAMQNLHRDLEEAFRKSKFIGKLEADYDGTSLVNFSIRITEEGADAQTLADQLSGFELRQQLPFEDVRDCDPKCIC